MAVVDKDLGLKAIIKELKYFKTAYVDVGLLSEGKADSIVDDKGQYIANYAAANEYGVPGKIPARSFIGSTVDENNGYKSVIEERVNKIFNGGTTTFTQLSLLGVQVQGDIKDKIGHNVPPPNAPSTIKAKTKGKGGVTTTLIDEGTMRNAINYKVT